MNQTLRVRYYAQLREALKTGSEDIAVPLPAREADILEHLSGLHPRQRPIFLASRVAVDDGYLGAGSIPAGTADIDIISPISGG